MIKSNGVYVTRCVSYVFADDVVSEKSMSEENIRRIYLTCGSAFLLVFCLTAALSIVTYGPSDSAVMIAVIVLAVSIAVLLFNSTMLFASSGGLKVLAAAKVLLWLAFILMVSAIVLCIISMTGSL